MILNRSNAVAFFKGPSRRILLVGDNHGVECEKDGPFGPIQWMMKQIRNAETRGMCLDIFLERQKNETDKLHEVLPVKSDLNAVCDVLDMLKTDEKSIRVHKIDARYVFDPVNDLIVYPFIPLYFENCNIGAAPESHFGEDAFMLWESYFKFLIGFPMSPINRGNALRVIATQFEYASTIMDEKSQSEVEAVFKSSHSVYLINVRDLLQRPAGKMTPAMINQIVKALAEVYASFDYRGLSLLFLCAPMDLYLLLRLHQRFQIEKMPRGPVDCRDERYSEVVNAIVHTGGAHTVHIKEALARLGTFGNLMYSVQNFEGNVVTLLPDMEDVFVS